MKMTPLRIKRIAKAINDYIVNDPDFYGLFKENVVDEGDPRPLIKDFSNEIANNIGNGDDVYLLDMGYVGINCVEIHPTPKTTLLIGLDEVWERAKDFLEYPCPK